jgi:hypothetical protein
VLSPVRQHGRRNAFPSEAAVPVDTRPALDLVGLRGVADNDACYGKQQFTSLSSPHVLLLEQQYMMLRSTQASLTTLSAS